MDKIHIKMKARKVVNNTDDVITEYTAPVYFASAGLLYFMYFVTFFGLFSINKNYIKNLSIFVRMLVSLFLLYRFNPLRKAELHPYDTKLICAAAILLLIEMFTTEIFTSITSLSQMVNGNHSTAPKAPKAPTLDNLHTVHSNHSSPLLNNVPIYVER